jgi:hypothetical protein
MDRPRFLRSLRRAFRGSSPIAALVARIGGSPRACPAYILAIRTIDLPAEVSTTNEEDAPANRASQLIQRDFVFHPPRGRKKSGRSKLAALSSPIVKLHPPDRGSRAVTLGPHSFTAGGPLPRLGGHREFSADIAVSHPRDGQISSDLDGRLHMRHYHRERNHQGLDNALIDGISQDTDGLGPVARRERLGGLLSFYYREAA